MRPLGRRQQSHVRPGRGGGRCGPRRISRLLAAFARRQGLDVTVIFDGRPNRRSAGDAQADTGAAAVRYSGARTADEVLAELVDADSAPRQLMVVSSDRQVRRHARRRRCKVVDALDFVPLLEAAAAWAAKALQAAPETQGLAKGQLNKWLKEFGLGSLANDNGED